MNLSIPQSNPKAGYLAHQAEIDAAVQRTLSSGWYILGQEVAAFEKEFAAFIGTAQSIGVANGTDALEIALRAAGVGPGDMVATVSHTAVATVAAIELTGATPLLVDIDPTSYTMCPESLRAAIQQASTHGPRKLKAIIVVHLYGHPADLTAISAIAKENDLTLIEDCAQCHGAAWKGQNAGTWGTLAAFSFYPTKNLGAFGDGGAVATNDPRLADRLRALREYGWQQRYVSQTAGMNSRLDELQAATLRVSLKYLALGNQRRRDIARHYSDALANAPVTRPTVNSNATHVFHQYVVRSQSRNELRTHLQQNGIGTLIHYPVPVHQQPAYVGRVSLAPGGLPETEQAAREVLSLPMFPQLTNEQATQVGEVVARWKPGSQKLG